MADSRRLAREAIHLRIQAARAIEEDGRPSEALSLVEPMVGDTSVPSAMKQMVLLSSALYSYEAGDSEKADSYLSKLEAQRPLPFAVGARAEWLRCQLNGGPVETLASIRDRFASRGLPVEAALVSLNLASIYLERGDLDAVVESASVSLELFKANKLPRETTAALAVLDSAARAGAVTQALLSDLGAQIRSSRPMD